MRDSTYVLLKDNTNVVVKINNFSKVVDSLTKRDTFAFLVPKRHLLGHLANLVNPPILIRVTP